MKTHELAPSEISEFFETTIHDQIHLGSFDQGVSQAMIHALEHYHRSASAISAMDREIMAISPSHNREG